MKARILLLALCVGTTLTYGQGKQYDKIVDIVVSVEDSLRAMIAAERMARQADNLAIQKQIESLRSELAARDAAMREAAAKEAAAREAAAKQAADAAKLMAPQAVQPSPAPAAAPSVRQPGFYANFMNRFRIETYDNSTTLSGAAKSGQSYMRDKISVTGQWIPVTDLEVNGKITSEIRHYLAPSEKVYASNEFFVDQLNAAWTFHDFVDGTVKLGRQDITLGEGFVVFDGTPLDGSRSMYFNAARLDLVVAPKQKITLFYTYVPRFDRGLPVIKDKSQQQLAEMPEQGIGVYTSSDFGPLNVQVYGIVKEVKSEDPKTVSQQINTAGARMKAPLCPFLIVTGEGAYQWGSYGDEKRSAFGGYLTLEYPTGLTTFFLPKTASIRTLYLSGDKAGTSRMEGWDPVYGRWPKYSESFVYTYVKEKAIAFWSNLAALNLETKLPCAQDVDLLLDYYYMLSATSAAPGAFPGGLGRIRGNMLEGRLTYRFSPVVSGHMVWERFVPGSFYFTGADISNWARIEFMINL